MSPSTAPAVPSVPLAVILTALDSILEREAGGLEGLLRIESRPRPHARGQGLDSAIAQVEWALGIGLELRGFLAALAPHEAALRALASAGEAA